jgi:hypothetical protein
MLKQLNFLATSDGSVLDSGKKSSSNQAVTPVLGGKALSEMPKSFEETSKKSQILMESIKEKNK